MLNIKGTNKQLCDFEQRFMREIVCVAFHSHEECDYMVSKSIKEEVLEYCETHNLKVKGNKQLEENHDFYNTNHA
jgi:hypothetical protein